MEMNLDKWEGGGPSGGNDPPTCHWSVTVLPLNYLGVILFDVG